MVPIAFPGARLLLVWPAAPAVDLTPPMSHVGRKPYNWHHWRSREGAMTFQDGWRCMRSPILSAAALVTLAGCGLPDDMALSMVDRGKYTFYNCDQLAAAAREKANREHELRSAMTQAASGAGGALVNAIAYRSEYLTVKGELQELQITAREKECREVIVPQSGTAIR
jgi:hypothetical protein